MEYTDQLNLHLFEFSHPLLVKSNVTKTFIKNTSTKLTRKQRRETKLIH